MCVCVQFVCSAPLVQKVTVGSMGALTPLWSHNVDMQESREIVHCIILCYNPLAPPPHPFSAPCSVQAETVETSSIMWSPDYQNSVDRYHVQVSPDPATPCPQEVGPSEAYRCSGLRTGEQYTITVNATNCGRQQESTTTFTVAPRGR